MLWFQTISDYNDKATPGSVTALGCFDGVHKGHRALLLAAKETARAKKLSFTVWSMTGKGGSESALLCTEEMRRTLLQGEIGADRVILAPFETVRELSCEEFVREILRGELRTSIAVCGENFRFGKGGAGDASTLRTLMRRHGGDALVLPLLRESTAEDTTRAGGHRMPENRAQETPVISSTWIKALLEEGNPTLAARLLGRSFAVSGEVLHGKALGRTLGFPTANLRFPTGIVVPKCGVYFGRVTLPSQARCFAVCNLGLRPTVEDGYGLLLECCLLGFSGSLYGMQLCVELLEFLRPERRFSSPQELQAQVLADLEAGKKLAETEATPQTSSNDSSKEA